MSEKIRDGQWVQELQIKKRTLDAPVNCESKGDMQIEWQTEVKIRPGEEMMKNLAVAASLVICAAVLRSGGVPPLNHATDAVLASVTGDVLLDENLGKLSFVSTMFPEATLVFGEQNTTSLSVPVMAGTVVHQWNHAEPYITWESAQDTVSASMAGEIQAIYHGNGEERVIQIMSDDGLSCLYGNIAECAVQIGDRVERGQRIGSLIQDAECVLEVRQNGYSVDPSDMLVDAP